MRMTSANEIHHGSVTWRLFPFPKVFPCVPTYPVAS